MKRIALTFVLAVMVSCTAMQAQHYVRRSANTGCENQIIRSYQGYAFQSVVLYTKCDRSDYLELWVEGVAACRIPLPVAYEVKDMRVYGTLLYFCGRHNSCGFIAVLDLHDMFTHAMSGTSPTSAAVSYTDLNPQYVSSLEKLVVYGDGNGVTPLPLTYANEHIAAIGKGGTATTADRVAVHIKYNNFPMTPPPVYSPYTIDVQVVDDNTSPGAEPLAEVLLTDDYVAFVRYRYSSDEYVIHRCDRNNLVGTYGTVCRYAVPHDEVIFNLDGEALEGNNIALATCAPTDMTYNDYEIRIRNIDLSNWVMFNSQYIPVDEAKQDVAVVYNKYQRKLVSSIYYPLPNEGYGYGLIEIDPWHTFTSPNYYTTSATHDQNDREFVPMDQNFYVHFVAMDKDGWLRKSLPMNTGYNGNCFELPDFVVYELPNATPIGGAMPYTTLGFSYIITPQEIVISDFTTNTECIIPE